MECYEAVFPNTKELVEGLLYVYDEDNKVCCITGYEDIKKLIPELLKQSNLSLNEISLFGDYDEEYILVLDEFGISVYCMKIFDEYMSYEADYLFVHKMCNQEVFDAVCSDVQEAVIYGYQFDNYVGIEIKNNGNRELYSFYSSDKEQIDEISDEIDRIIRSLRDNS